MLPAIGRPKGIVHMVGGAFVGAAPQIAYSLLMDEISKGGYTVVTTPFKLSFKHLEVAN